jgi:hypothetical protein
MTRKHYISLLLGVAAVATIGCAPPPPPGAVYVMRGPPGEIVEVAPGSPGPGYVWVQGYYRWEGAEYHWERGRWALTPAGYRAWLPGHWREHEGRWYFVEGHWS